MNEERVAAVTAATGRKFLFHFTRASNLAGMAHFDALLSSYEIDPRAAGERRVKARNAKVDECAITINAHLRIADSMIDPAITQEQFRACLDRHIFFWPTVRDCRKMMDTYARREPDERFAVLEFDAYSLLTAHEAAVKLTKYDSGSSPRFPAHCSYKKSLDMFLPLNRFKSEVSSLVPAKASEIREVLIETRVNRISDYLRAVYVDAEEAVPARWRHLARPLAEFGQIFA